MGGGAAYCGRSLGQVLGLVCLVTGLLIFLKFPNTILHQEELAACKEMTGN